MNGALPRTLPPSLIGIFIALPVSLFLKQGKEVDMLIYSGNRNNEIAGGCPWLQIFQICCFDIKEHPALKVIFLRPMEGTVTWNRRFQIDQLSLSWPAAIWSFIKHLYECINVSSGTSFLATMVVATQQRLLHRFYAFYMCRQEQQPLYRNHIH